MGARSSGAQQCLCWGTYQLKLWATQLFKVWPHEMLILYFQENIRLIQFIDKIPGYPRSEASRSEKYHRWLLYDEQYWAKGEIEPV